MKSFSTAKDQTGIGQAFEEALAIDPTVFFLFATPPVLRDDALRSFILEKTRGRAIIGCSTAGEIANDGAHSGGISLLAVRFDKTPVRLAACPLPKAEDSIIAGQALGEQLKTEDLSAVFVLGPGTNVNGSSLADGLFSILGKQVIVSGGLAGDEMSFKLTHTICGENIYENYAVAIGLYGKNIAVSCGSEGGWRPFGPARRVTKAQDNILQELDGKPALQLYKQYLGEKARDLPASGLAYPFAILREDRTMSGLIRSALSIDHENGALVMAGDVPQGSRVCLMHADTDALIQGAAQAAAEAIRTHPGPERNGCALLVDCVGRRKVLGIDMDEEIEAVADSFLPGTPFAGFYSYGQISSSIGERPSLRSQTMTITYLTEMDSL